MRLIINNKDLSYDLMHIDIWDFSDYEYEWHPTWDGGHKIYDRDADGNKIMGSPSFRLVATPTYIEFNPDNEEAFMLDGVVVLGIYDSYNAALAERKNITRAYESDQKIYEIDTIKV